MSTQELKASPDPLVTELCTTSAQALAQRPRKSPSGAVEVLLYFCSNPKLPGMRAPSLVPVALSSMV